MSEKTVKFSPEKLDLLIKQSHEFHQVFQFAMEEYGKAEMKLIDDLLDFTYKILQVIGIFAGFGFTAIQAVRNQWFFAIGEVLLISGILYGIFKVKEIYAHNLEAVQKSSQRKFNVFNQKSIFFQKYINEFTNKGTIDSEEFERELKAVDNSLLEEFSKEKNATKKKDEGKFLNLIIISSILGSLFLLAAFIKFPTLFSSHSSSTTIKVEKSLERGRQIIKKY